MARIQLLSKGVDEKAQLDGAEILSRDKFLAARIMPRVNVELNVIFKQAPKG